MAAYATAADFASLGLPTKATASVSAGDIDAALEAASRVVDSYIGSRYDLPLITYDKSVTMAVCKIAAFELLSRRGFAAGATDATTLELRYNQALQWCRDVARGLALPAPKSTTDATKPPVDPNNAPFVRQPQVSTASGTVTTGVPNLRGW
jgi:phage gp36-like protein